MDDEEDIRLLLRAALVRRGYSVIVAGDGKQALAALAERAGCVRAVVTDLDMPIMDGVELTVQLVTGLPWLPIILMTGGPRQMSPLSGIPALLKPFALSALLELLEATCADESRGSGRAEST